LAVVGFLACLLGTPEQGFALKLGGSLSWDFARTQSETQFSNAVQTGFAQSYRINTSGAVLHPNIAQWSLGGGWRRDLSSSTGTSAGGDRDVRLTNFDAGLVLIPRIMPIAINFRRSLVEDKASGTTGTNNLNSTVSLSTRIPMGDGEPLGITAHQTTQGSDAGDHRSRLLSLSKRFNLGARSHLDSTYRYSEFSAPTTTETAHGLSLTEHTQWTDRLASNVFANLSTRTSTATRRAGGRSLFINNGYGGALHYRRGLGTSGTLRYSFSETPQDQADDLTNHQLSGDGRVRLSTKTDIDGNFAYRRLSLANGTLDTSSINVGLRHRPIFGWVVGGRVGASENRVDFDTSSSRRQTYHGNGFVSGQHDLRVADIRWGTEVGYSTTSGSISQDRMRSSAHVSVTEKQLRVVRIIGEYRLSEAREVKAGKGMSQIDVQHSTTLTATATPIRALWLPTDSLRGSMRMGAHWSRRDDADQTLVGREMEMDANYVAWAGLNANAGFKITDNSDAPAGSSRVIHAGASWSKRVMRRGSGKLVGDARANYLGSKYESSEVGLGYTFTYSIGLVHASLTADAKRLDLSGSRYSSNSNSVRLNITRTF
jgi:hypothetical protein